MTSTWRSVFFPIVYKYANARAQHFLFHKHNMTQLSWAGEVTLRRRALHATRLLLNRVKKTRSNELSSSSTIASSLSSGRQKDKSSSLPAHALSSWLMSTRTRTLVHPSSSRAIPPLHGVVTNSRPLPRFRDPRQLAPLHNKPVNGHRQESKHGVCII